MAPILISARAEPSSDPSVVSYDSTSNSSWPIAVALVIAGVVSALIVSIFFWRSIVRAKRRKLHDAGSESKGGDSVIQHLPAAEATRGKAIRGAIPKSIVTRFSARPSNKTDRTKRPDIVAPGHPGTTGRGFQTISAPRISPFEAERIVCLPLHSDQIRTEPVRREKDLLPHPLRANPYLPIFEDFSRSRSDFSKLSQETFLTSKKDVAPLPTISLPPPTHVSTYKRYQSNPLTRSRPAKYHPTLRPPTDKSPTHPPNALHSIPATHLLVPYPDPVTQRFRSKPLPSLPPPLAIMQGPPMQKSPVMIGAPPTRGNSEIVLTQSDLASLYGAPLPSPPHSLKKLSEPCEAQDEVLEEESSRTKEEEHNDEEVSESDQRSVSDSSEVTSSEILEKESIQHCTLADHGYNYNIEEQIWFKNRERRVRRMCEGTDGCREALGMIYGTAKWNI